MPVNYHGQHMYKDVEVERIKYKGFALLRKYSLYESKHSEDNI